MHRSLVAALAIAGAFTAALYAAPAWADNGALAADPRPANPDHIITYRAQVMGTDVNLTIWGEDEKAAAAASEAALDELRRVDKLMSSWLPGSDVSKINAAAGKRAVKVSPEVLKVILKAQVVAQKTGGAFDITVGAFHGLWKFGEDRDGSIPSPEAVKERVEKVGYRDVIVNRRRRTVKLRRRGMRITLGGIAKGYAVDRVVAIMRKRGFADFIIQVGGDLYASGRRGDRAWRVGIRDPRGDRASTFAVAEIENRTFSTSGDYERGFVKDGVRYHHILDPETGRPARKSRSVTVLAKDAFTADAWSTSLFVLGAERGMKIVEAMPDVEAVIVDAQNHIHVSSGLRTKLHILRQPTPGI
ncbi:MAG TPA: FAD:protein FMN transferase [Kofleriaceae bacterium]|nr:FAD:protein FMN transferase [Kofleriaceae bacterium]